MKRPIAMTSVQEEAGRVVHRVLCDDGTVYEMRRGIEWEEVEPVPGTSRYEELGSGPLPSYRPRGE